MFAEKKKSGEGKEGNYLEKEINQRRKVFVAEKKKGGGGNGGKHLEKENTTLCRRGKGILNCLIWVLVAL